MIAAAGRIRAATLQSLRSGKARTADLGGSARTGDCVAAICSPIPVIPSSVINSRNKKYFSPMYGFSASTAIVFSSVTFTSVFVFPVSPKQ